MSDATARPRVQPRGPALRIASRRRAAQVEKVNSLRADGGFRKARGVRVPGSGASFPGLEGMGTIPWYVPEGAEFEAEQARGYFPSSMFAGGDCPWDDDAAYVTYELTDAELRHLTSPHADEWEDVEDGGAAPVRARVRAGGWVDRDFDRFDGRGWTPHSQDELRAQAEIEAVERDFDDTGNPRRGRPEAPDAEDSSAELRRIARMKRQAKKRLEEKYAREARERLAAWEDAQRDIEAREAIEHYLDTIDWLEAMSDYDYAAMRVWGV